MRSEVLLCALFAALPFAASCVALLGWYMPRALDNEGRIPFTCTTSVGFTPKLCRPDGMTVQCYYIYRTLASTPACSNGVVIAVTAELQVAEQYVRNYPPHSVSCYVKAATRCDPLLELYSTLPALIAGCVFASLALALVVASAGLHWRRLKGEYNEIA